MYDVPLRAGAGGLQQVVAGIDSPYDEAARRPGQRVVEGGVGAGIDVDDPTHVQQLERVRRPRAGIQAAVLVQVRLVRLPPHEVGLQQGGPVYHRPTFQPCLDAHRRGSKGPGRGACRCRGAVRVRGVDWEVPCEGPL